MRFLLISTTTLIILVLSNSALAETLKVTKITRSPWHGCALFSSGKVKCWGSNYTGELNLGYKDEIGDDPGEMGDNLPYIDTNEKVVNLWGDSATCVQFESKKVKCWGYGKYGKLGNENDVTLGDDAGEEAKNLPYLNLGDDFIVKEISMSRDTACALSEKKQVKCWGENHKGQLGLGDIKIRGIAAGTMGNNLPTLDLGSNLVPVKVAVGGSHSCALFENGKVKCWGANSDKGYLGYGKDTNLGDEPDEMGDKLPFVDIGDELAIDITNSGSNTCVLTKFGNVKCWGLGILGTNGIGSTENIGDEEADMGKNLKSVDLGTGNIVTKIEGVGNSMCATLYNKTVKCWGDNFFGKLGLSERDYNVGSSPEEMGDNLEYLELGTKLNPTQIVGGDLSMCALVSEKVKCWGTGKFGELGTESDERLGDDAGEMGDNLPFINLGTK